MGLTFDRFFELSPSFMLVVDLDGRIVAINGALLEALGQGEAELRGRSIAELLHPDDVEASAMARRQAGSGGKVIDAERRMRRRDGTYLLTSWRATAEDGLIYSVGVDLTQSRRIERLNQEAQALAKVGGFERDLERGERYWTPETYRLLEVSPEADVGLETMLQRLAPSQQQVLMQAMAAAQTTGQPAEVTVEWRRLDGSLRFLRVVVHTEVKDGRPSRVVGALQDVTNLRLAEQAHQDSEERYRALYERTPAMLHSIDREGRLIYVSDRWLEILGYTRAEVIGRRSTEFLTEASRTYAREVVLPEFLRTGRCEDVEYQFLTKDGRVVDVLLSATSERDEAGEVRQSLAVLADVTEKKRADAALLASLQEKEVLLKEVHHRVKNNLQVITSLLSLQAQRVDSTSAAILIDAQNRVRAMAQVHERLYLSADLARVDFGAYLDELLLELRRALHRPGVEVIGRAPGLHLSVETAIPCGLIINELVGNALKHAFPDGRPGKVEVELVAAGPGLVLTVEDNGIGSPDPRGRGTMGWRLVERLVGQLGGTVELRSPPGTMVRVQFRSAQGPTS
ncbi:MAG: PAS domain S-box protein [Deltaproteobacteria bacterium]|nr:PAS domain S-box protein [Deltaproteobacteria bacterium]